MQTDSFTQIYQSYFDPVYRYTLSLSGSPHIAEEITQETFFKALRSLRYYRIMQTSSKSAIIGL